MDLRQFFAEQVDQLLEISFNQICIFIACDKILYHLFAVVLSFCNFQIPKKYHRIISDKILQFNPDVIFCLGGWIKKHLQMYSWAKLWQT